jgi:hypothetical protein
MEIEYQSDKFDSIVAPSAEDAVRKHKKRMDNEGVPYSGVVATEKCEVDVKKNSVYIVRAIKIDGVK